MESRKQQMNKTSPADPMTPTPWRILRRKRELADTVSLELAPEGENMGFKFSPGQFNMLYAFGAGEVPISISGDPINVGTLVHTIRDVGGVSHALVSLNKGDVIGVRGPFGSAWPVEQAEGSDIVIIAGGIGLAPLRPFIYRVLANRKKYGRFVILFGARGPDEILFRRELKKWQKRMDVYIDVTVDQAPGDWTGNVGTVIKLIGRATFDVNNAMVFVCGPEIMMRFAISELQEMGLSNDSLFVSMERNMKCAVGICGHCQFGDKFICKDGPVFPYKTIENLIRVREI
jgi:NAD(P)H-flavin reductase